MAVHSQRIADMLDASNHMLHYIGGDSQTLFCDNLCTAVTRSDRYEPVFTDLCYQLSEHYGTSFSATRPGKPGNKAMVEKAVSLVYRYVYAPLRNHNLLLFLGSHLPDCPEYLPPMNCWLSTCQSAL